MNPVSGFGFHSGWNNTQMFAIFKDGTRSHHYAKQLDQFKETHFDQTLTPIKTIKVRYFSENTKNLEGLLFGIELLDFSDQTICRAGNQIEIYRETEVKQFDLKKGERLLGITYGRRWQPNLSNAFDVQFIVGKQSSQTD